MEAFLMESYLTTCPCERFEYLSFIIPNGQTYSKLIYSCDYKNPPITKKEGKKHFRNVKK